MHWRLAMAATRWHATLQAQSENTQKASRLEFQEQCHANKNEHATGNLLATHYHGLEHVGPEKRMSLGSSQRRVQGF